MRMKIIWLHIKEYWTDVLIWCRDRLPERDVDRSC